MELDFQKFFVIATIFRAPQKMFGACIVRDTNVQQISKLCFRGVFRTLKAVNYFLKKLYLTCYVSLHVELCLIKITIVMQSFFELISMLQASDFTKKELSHDYFQGSFLNFSLKGRNFNKLEHG